MVTLLVAVSNLNKSLCVFLYDIPRLLFPFTYYCTPDSRARVGIVKHYCETEFQNIYHICIDIE